MFTSDEIVNATEGSLLAGEGTFAGLSIDSRSVKQDDLFVCIKGDRFDGHNFIQDALKKGATGVVVSDKESIAKACIIAVEDTTKALGDIANYHRNKFDIPVIGITGSNGKTTTKEMIASILDLRFKTLKNKGNLNNLIGVPLTLFELTKDHKAAVIEMGMNKKGEIDQLSKIACPTIGVITNVGAAHMEFFDSIDEIKKEKESLVAHMGKHSTTILNRDDSHVYAMTNTARGKTITYGTSEDSEVRAININKNDLSDYSFDLTYAGTGKQICIPIQLSVPGYHNVYNALSAAAVGVSLNFDQELIKKGLESYTGMSMRMEIIRKKGMTILNDAYNANPVSVKAALQTLGDIAEKSVSSTRKIFVFGDMFELGETSQAEHIKIGAEVINRKVDILITAGKDARWTAQEALKKGMQKNHVITCSDAKEAGEAIKEHKRQGDTILIKGSRGMKMETVAKHLLITG